MTKRFAAVDEGIGTGDLQVHITGTELAASRSQPPGFGRSTVGSDEDVDAAGANEGTSIEVDHDAGTGAVAYATGIRAPRIMQPDVVMEVAVDVTRDASGRWQHPARPNRVRSDIDVQDVPLFGEDRSTSS